VELEAGRVVDTQRLVLNRTSPGEQRTAVRDREGLAMQLEHTELVRELCDGAGGTGLASERVPAGLFHERVDLPAKCGGDELGAEADAEDFPPVFL